MFAAATDAKLHTLSAILKSHTKETMESIWILPIYIILPFFGLLISIIGFIRFNSGKGKKLIFPGLFLLSIPFLHLLLVYFQSNNLENKLVGEYKYGDLNHVLKIYDDGKFELERGYLFTISGNGTWETQIIDFPILILDFGNWISDFAGI